MFWGHIHKHHFIPVIRASKNTRTFLLTRIRRCAWGINGEWEKREGCCLLSIIPHTPLGCASLIYKIINRRMRDDWGRVSWRDNWFSQKPILCDVDVSITTAVQGIRGHAAFAKAVRKSREASTKRSWILRCLKQKLRLKILLYRWIESTNMYWFFSAVDFKISKRSYIVR